MSCTRATMLLTAAALAFCPAGFAGRATDDGFPDFHRRIDAYMKLRNTVEKRVPPVGKKGNAAQIDTHQRAFAAALRKARAGAKPGDIITPETRARFTKMIGQEMKGRANKSVRETAKVGNPDIPAASDTEASVDVDVSVNAMYPRNAPVSMMPPSVLLRLPKLPKELEYRFVGRTLILRDTVADIIVDYADNVAPPL